MTNRLAAERANTTTSTRWATRSRRIIHRPSSPSRVPNRRLVSPTVHPRQDRQWLTDCSIGFPSLWQTLNTVVSASSPKVRLLHICNCDERARRRGGAAARRRGNRESIVTIDFVSVDAQRTLSRRLPDRGQVDVRTLGQWRRSSNFSLGIVQPWARSKWAVSQTVPRRLRHRRVIYNSVL